jgi:predicted DNA-binding protein (MmcQ/YjbR family)|tara:strand:+ start:21358 stop:21711 length:354 start_codon:yes stop_codon:yes gene_type:complete
MTLEEYREYCLQKAGVTEHLPFDINTLVFKVGNKMFALTDINSFSSINLKCDPERAIELREQYSEIIPGYHMNKRLWNTVSTIDSLEDSFILELIDHSYDLILESLPKKTREEIENR